MYKEGPPRQANEVTNQAVDVVVDELPINVAERESFNISLVPEKLFFRKNKEVNLCLRHD